MKSQRLLQRSVRYFAHQKPWPGFRSPLQRRFASSGEPPLTGAADNAFNRERRAVKQHAAESSGEWDSFEYLQRKHWLNSRSDLWRKLAI